MSKFAEAMLRDKFERNLLEIKTNVNSLSNEDIFSRASTSQLASNCQRYRNKIKKLRENYGIEFLDLQKKYNLLFSKVNLGDAYFND